MPHPPRTHLVFRLAPHLHTGPIHRRTITRCTVSSSCLVATPTRSMKFVATAMPGFKEAMAERTLTPSGLAHFFFGSAGSSLKLPL
jgi:hypothetical protein